MKDLEASYSSPITFKKYWTAVLSGDKSILPPYWKAGTYIVFEGKVPRYVGRQHLDRRRGGILGRTNDLVIEAFGITGDGVDAGSDNAYYHAGGRLIFLHFQNCGGTAAVCQLRLVWRDEICPNCEEYRIYTKYGGGRNSSPLLNRKPVYPCREHPHT